MEYESILPVKIKLFKAVRGKNKVYMSKHAE